MVQVPSSAQSGCGSSLYSRVNSEHGYVPWALDNQG